MKLFRRFRDSMTVSTSTLLRARPSTEHRPVSTSKNRNVEAAMSTSEHSRARPISRLVYFRRIMARISVPPVEPSRLKRMAEPKAGKATAKNSSRIFWSVSGPLSGTSQPSADRMPENSREQYTVRTPKPRLSTMKPSSRNSRLMTDAKVDELTAGKMDESTTAMPVTPPVEKWLGNLKK